MLSNPEGPTCEREVEGWWRRTTIDPAFHRDVGGEPVKGVKFLANYWSIRGSMEVGDLWGVRRIREGNV